MKKPCLIIQLLLLIIFVILLVTNILGYVNYDDVRYIINAIVVLSVINLIIIIRAEAEADKQISQTAKRNIVIIAVVFGVFVTAFALIQLF
jgi:hypothetical protein